MTFTQHAKEEILNHLTKSKGCCAHACLYALLLSAGSYSIVGKSMGMCVTSENEGVIEWANSLVKQLFGREMLITTDSSLTLRKGVQYTLHVDHQVLTHYQLVYIDEEDCLQLGNDSFDDSIVERECCLKAFLQTVFVTCGSVILPQGEDGLASSTTGRYHMEIYLHSESLAYNIDMLLSNANYNWHMIHRTRGTTLYIKDSETISDMLVYFGAVKAKLQLDNIVVNRHFRNAINRQVNCINANLDKAVNASDKHIKAINKIIEGGLFNQLSEKLQVVAQLRLDNSSDTLEELSVKCGVSKSGVRHRLNKLIELADKL